jgi:hypothetical protein
MPITLNSPSGPVRIPDTFLFVGIDETGHEEFPDGHPTFGLGGCGVPVGTYARQVHLPWNSLKKALFGGAEVAMHANELRNPSPDQIVGLADFFRSNSFGRIAVLVSDDTERDPTVPTFQIAARMVLEYITRLATEFRCDGVAMVIEASQRTDRLAATYFEGYHLEQQTTDGKKTLPFLEFRMSKSGCLPLLEVADFIIHKCEVHEVGWLGEHAAILKLCFGASHHRSRNSSTCVKFRSTVLVKMSKCHEARANSTE